MGDEGAQPHLILCNGAHRPRKTGNWHNAPTLELSTYGTGNMAIRIRQAGCLVNGTLSPRAVDLLEIIACICVADEATANGYGSIRRFHFEVAVRDPAFWGQEQIVSLLCDLAQSLCDDMFEFGFARHLAPPSFSEYLGFPPLQRKVHAVERVLPFAGDVDSLAGAIEEIFCFGRRIALVGHDPNAHLLRRLTGLVRQLRERVASHNPALKPAAMSITVKKKAWSNGCRPVPHTRSLLVTTLSAIIASLSELSEVHLYENGITSINLPLPGSAIGAPASRTSHPETLSRLASILTCVFEKRFAVHNEYLWLTKQEVVQRVSDYRHASLIAHAVSCIQTDRTTEHHPQCGGCSRCLARRIAVIGAGVERYDPASLYQRDVLTGRRHALVEQNMAEWSVAQAHQIGGLASAEEFAQLYGPDLARVAAYLSGDKEIQHELLYDLHHRHARQFNKALLGAMGQYLGEYYTRKLEPTSVLAKAFALGGRQDGERKVMSAIRSTREPVTPTADERVVLEILAGAKHPMTHASVEADTTPRGRHVGLRTLRALLRSLEDRGWVCYPRGRRRGVWLTDEGRRRVDVEFGASA